MRGADCTTKGAIMRPSGNHHAFWPLFDPMETHPISLSLFLLQQYSIALRSNLARARARQSSVHRSLALSPCVKNVLMSDCRLESRAVNENTASYLFLCRRRHSPRLFKPPHDFSYILLFYQLLPFFLSRYTTFPSSVYSYIYTRCPYIYTSAVGVMASFLPVHASSAFFSALSLFSFIIELRFLALRSFARCICVCVYIVLRFYYTRRERGSFAARSQ